ncbi:MAG: glycosyltransferase [Alphaproteobacteria bacterium]|nr:glycosyltransferase [Alphaproteobacteria bacterium]
MLFSIITIAKNNRAGLARTSISVQNQSLTDHEWIIIDGASTDGTAEDLPTYSAHVVSEPDHGIYDAMNKGLAHAKGDYVVFMNAGDRFATTTTLAILAAEIKNTSADFLYGDAWEESIRTDAIFYKSARDLTGLAYGMPTHHQAMIYRRETIGALRYDTDYKIAADYDFTCRFLLQDPAPKVRRLREPLCFYALGGLSMQFAGRARWEDFLIRQRLHMMPLPLNMMFTMAKTAPWLIRSASPGLYHWLRSLNNRPLAPVQNQTLPGRPAIRLE